MEKCPRCGGNLAKIIYGMPSSDIIEKLDKKEVYIAGCEIVLGKEQPKYYCYNCKCKYNDVSDNEDIVINDTNEEDKKRYIFVRRFDEVNKVLGEETYYYKSNLDLAVGNYVEVEESNRRAIGLVFKIEYFSKEEAPTPYDELKSIIRKADFINLMDDKDSKTLEIEELHDLLSNAIIGKIHIEKLVDLLKDKHKFRGVNDLYYYPKLNTFFYKCIDKTDYFHAEYKTEVITQNMYATIIKELEKVEYLDDIEFTNYKKFLLEELVDIISSLNTLKFDVKQKLQYVEKYKEKVNWDNLTDLKVKEIKDNLTSLISSTDDDECAKQFDKLMLSVELSKILNMKYDREISRLGYIGEKLILKANTITQVSNQMIELKKIIDPDYLLKSDIIEIDKIREKVRYLLKYLDKGSTTYYFTDFNDELNVVEHDDRRIVQTELTDYKKKMSFYLKSHLDNKVINKIRNNEEITQEDINELQSILFNDLNSNGSEFKLNYNDESLVLLVRKTVGLSKETIDSLFAKYINENELNVNQTRFINLIKNYIMKNGVIDKRILNEDPFTNYGKITEIFSGQLNIIHMIVAIINMINSNGEYIQSEN